MGLYLYLHLNVLDFNIYIRTRERGSEAIRPNITGLFVYDFLLRRVIKRICAKLRNTLINRLSAMSSILNMTPWSLRTAVTPDTLKVIKNLNFLQNGTLR